MKRGAFGVTPDGRSARYAEGQRWLEGSAPEFAATLRRELLDTFFPPLVDCAPRTSPDWANREGLVHILGRGQNWYVVSCHQPAFSLARSITLWLCMQFTPEEFADRLSLASALTELSDCREAMQGNGDAVMRWLQSNDRPVSSQPTVEDLRACAYLSDQLGVGSGCSVPGFSEKAFWRGYQLLLEAWRAQRDDIWAVVRIESSGRVPVQNGREPLRRVVLRRDLPCELPAFTCRGVPDSIPMGALGARVMITQGVGYPDGKATRQFVDGIQVPPEILPYEELANAAEWNPWARARWDQPLEAERWMEDLAERIRGMATRTGDRKKAIKILTAILSSDPLLRAGDSSRACRILGQMASGR